jgi:hypothetical protein
MVLPVGSCDEEGPGLPEKGVPCGGGTGEGAAPTANPVLGLPARISTALSFFFIKCKKYIKSKTSKTSLQYKLEASKEQSKYISSNRE